MHYLTSKYLMGLLAMLVFVIGSSCGEQADQLSPTEIARSKIAPETRQFLFNAQQAMGRGAMQEALVLADSAIERAPGLSDTYFLRGRILTEMKQFDAAEEAFEKVLDLDPGYRLASFNLGNMAFGRDRYQEALSYYMHTLDAKGLDDIDVSRPPASIDQKRKTQTLIQIGRTYLKLGEYDNTRTAYGLALESDSTDAVVYSDLGVMARDDGDTDKALNYAKRATELAPNDVSYLYFYGALLVQNGKYEEAIPILQSVLQLRPWQQGAHFNLGQALVRTGKMDEGRQVLALADSVQIIQTNIDQIQASIDQEPNHLPNWIGLGKLYIRSQRYQEAKSAFNFVLQRQPANTDALYHLALTQFLAGDAPMARFTLRSLLRQEPGHVEAKKLLEQIVQ